MNDTLTALPPHTEAATEPKGFDVDSFAQELASTPKQDSGAANPPPPKPEPGAPGPDAAPGAGSATSSDTGPDEKARKSATFIVAIYDRIQANAFAMMSQRDTPERYTMSKSEREEAAQYLAQGIQESGSFEVPWWVPLLAVVGISAFGNYQLATASRKKHVREEERKREEARRAAQGEPIPVHPSSITDRAGRTEPYRPAPVYSPTGDRCRMCGSPCKKGRKYCSQRCAGKGTAAKRRSKTNSDQ